VRRPLLAMLTMVVLAVAMVVPVRADFTVVVTNKPVHALVATVMYGVAEPRLLVKGSSSPHTYALLPSDAAALNEASLFFLVSPVIEPFTLKLMASLPKSVQVVSIMDAPSLKLLPRRRGPIFDRLAAHGGNVDLTGGVDGHAWLDPANANIIVAYIAWELSRSDPVHAGIYQSNAKALHERLEALATELDSELRPISHRPYIVFHDAMQYFEHRFGLTAIGSISVSPEIPPSAKRLIELRSKIRASGAVCAFAEPQFSAALVNTVVEDTGVRVGALDPEAINLAPGPNLYFTLMHALAAELTRCLANPT